VDLAAARAALACGNPAECPVVEGAGAV
jgi:hypothetical protein